MPRRPFVLVPAVVGVLLGAGCQDAQPAACPTTAPGPSGVTVTIPQELYITAGSVSVKVCATTCRETTLPISREPSAQARVLTATFDALHRTFTPGPVIVYVDQKGASGKVVAHRIQQIVLATDTGCGTADAAVTGRVTMTPDDRVARR